MDSGKILIVDDEASIRHALKTTLRNLGFTTVEAARGEEAIALVRTIQFDAVLLDINMPGMSGIEVCRQLRAHSARLPILMLTVRDSEDDTVEALGEGADDYIVKPFQLRELVARIRASMRMARSIKEETETVLTVGPIVLDPMRRTVAKGGQPIRFTPKEFELLHSLMTRAGTPVSHARLLTKIWGPEYGEELEYLRTFIHQLRKKLEEDPSNPKYLLTEPQYGYRFSEGQL